LLSITTVFGVTAAVLHGTGYVLYNIQTKRRDSEPNITTWMIGAFLAGLNAFSYRAMNHDTVMALQFFVGTVGSILTFFITLFTGRFSWPEIRAWWCAALAFIALLVWWYLRNATGANFIVLFAVLVSFQPMLEGVLKDPHKETPRSWVIWTVAYYISTINVALFSDNHWAFVSPLVLLFVHGSIAVLSRSARKALFPRPE